MTACSEARQARIGVESSAEGFLSCLCFSTGLFYIKSCETWGLGRKNWQRLNSCICGAETRIPCGMVWSRFSLPVCAWFFCLLLSIYLNALLTWILKCKAIFCLQGTRGEMLGVSVAENCTLLCLLLINEQPLTQCKTLQITVNLSQFKSKVSM